MKILMNLISSVNNWLARQTSVLVPWLGHFFSDTVVCLCFWLDCKFCTYGQTGCVYCLLLWIGIQLMRSQSRDLVNLYASSLVAKHMMYVAKHTMYASSCITVLSLYLMFS